MKKKFSQQIKSFKIFSFPYVASVAAFGAPMYYNMASVVGEPNKPELQEELLERVYSLFKETVALLKKQ